MSQMPPNPYGTPQQPPPGYPPPGYVQQGYPPGQPYGPQRTSGTAIASLVVGLLGICPLVFIGGLIATILGIVGISATGKPGVKGRGMAIAGLILGLLGMGIWGLAAAGGGYAWAVTAPDRTAARQFVVAEAAGDVTKAASLCEAGTTPESLQTTADELKPLGTLQDTTMVGFNANAHAGGGAMTEVRIMAKFPGAMKMVVVTVNSGSGGHKVHSWLVE